MHNKNFSKSLLLAILISISFNNSLQSMEFLVNRIEFFKDNFELFANTKLGDTTIYIASTCLVTFLTVLIGTKTYSWFSQERPIMPTQPTVTLNDVAGIESNKDIFQEVFELVDMIQNKEAYTNLGVTLPRGILFEGPPGNGKSLLAQAIAGSLNCFYFPEVMSDFNTKWVGTGAEKIKKLFEIARKKALIKTVIMFLDELDSIGNREQERTGTVDQTIAQLLKELSEPNENIIILAATNLRTNIDPALIRSDRFSSIIKVPQPNDVMRCEILQFFSRNLKLNIPEDFLAKLARKTVKFSGADLKELTRQSGIIAGFAKSKDVSKNHFKKGFNRVRLKIQTEQIEKQRVLTDSYPFSYQQNFSSYPTESSSYHIPFNKTSNALVMPSSYEQQELKERDAWADYYLKSENQN